MEMQTNITTERLLLNIITEEDHDFMQELMNTHGWIQFIGDRRIHSREAAIGYINAINGRPNFYYWLVRLKETHSPVGIITFIKRDYLDHFDIGFAFLPEYNGNGYAYEAAREVLSVVRLQGEHQIVQATTLPENVRSIKLLNRLGLGFTGKIMVGKNELCLYSTTFNVDA
jgi:[ribosomal protein S5]-alanine N-acetyltransferase